MIRGGDGSHVWIKYGGYIAVKSQNVAEAWRWVGCVRPR